MKDIVMCQAPGSDKTLGQGYFGSFTSGLNLKNLKIEEWTVHRTRFTKTRWTWHVTLYCFQGHSNYPMQRIWRN